MTTLPKIVRIIKIQSFKITLLWSNFEIRLLDFGLLLDQWETEGDTTFAALRDKKAFKSVVLSENHTLCWPNITQSFTYKGKTRTEPLELDAQELYRLSQLVRKVAPLQLGAMLREARKKAGLTQADVALNSGTTSKYISRIEHDKSDIQLGTLQKIIELGIGKKMYISIEDEVGVVMAQEESPEIKRVKK